MELSRSDVDRALTQIVELGLLNDVEHDEILSVLNTDFPFAEALGFIDSVHAHVKVDDVDSLPHDELVALGYEAQNGKSGYIKYATGVGINFIFSSINIAEDDRVDGAVVLPKPFMDHVGFDMRDEATPTEGAFDRIPGRAEELGWREVTQQGPVHCCHTQVKQKHWTYPPEGWAGWRRPIEFAFGDLVIFDHAMGCNLRPMDPGHPLAPTTTVSCDGAPAPVACAGSQPSVSGASSTI